MLCESLGILIPSTPARLLGYDDETAFFAMSQQCKNYLKLDLMSSDV